MAVSCCTYMLKEDGLVFLLIFYTITVDRSSSRCPSKTQSRCSQEGSTGPRGANQAGTGCPRHPSTDTTTLPRVQPVQQGERTAGRHQHEAVRSACGTDTSERNQPSGQFQLHSSIVL